MTKDLRGVCTQPSHVQLADVIGGCWCWRWRWCCGAGAGAGAGAGDNGDAGDAGAAGAAGAAAVDGGAVAATDPIVYYSYIVLVLYATLLCTVYPIL